MSKKTIFPPILLLSIITHIAIAADTVTSSIDDDIVLPSTKIARPGSRPQMYAVMGANEKTKALVKYRCLTYEEAKTKAEELRSMQYMSSISIFKIPRDIMYIDKDKGPVYACQDKK